MELIRSVLPWLQVILAIAVTGAILLQRNDAALGGVFGGGSSITHTKRGLEHGLFVTTIILTILFIGTAILSLLIQTTT